MPDKVTLYITAINDRERMGDMLYFWDDVYGFNMTAIKELVFNEPTIGLVERSNVLSDAASIWHIDLLEPRIPDADAFSANFQLISKRNDTCHGLAGFFDCEFSNLPNPVFFSTGPHAKPTHWFQTIFQLRTPINLRRGEKLKGNIKCFPTNKENDLDVNIKLELPAGNIMNQTYRLHDMMTFPMVSLV